MSSLVRFQDNYSVFIETGFGHGSTIAEVVKRPYEEIHSIEIDPDLYARGVALFKAYPNVHLHNGSSPDILPTIIKPEKPTFFWLDAHYSAGMYTGSQEKDNSLVDKRYGQCPLLAELKIIVNTPWQSKPLILIDDAICFTKQVYDSYRGHDLRTYDRSQYP